MLSFIHPCSFAFMQWRFNATFKFCFNAIVPSVTSKLQTKHQKNKKTYIEVNTRQYSFTKRQHWQAVRLEGKKVLNRWVAGKAKGTKITEIWQQVFSMHTTQKLSRIKGNVNNLIDKKKQPSYEHNTPHPSPSRPSHYPQMSTKKRWAKGVKRWKRFFEPGKSFTKYI